MSKEERLRAEGMAFCARYLESHNYDGYALAEEIKRRGASHVPIGISPSEEHEYENRVRRSCLDTVLVMSLVVLHDEFGFGHSRLDRFKARFNLKSEAMGKGLTTWREQQEILIRESGIEQDIRFNGDIDEVNE